MCASVHDQADDLYRSCVARFGGDGKNL
ncbi:Rop family plasmid primer RNA-binding protein [Escherichia coli]